MSWQVLCGDAREKLRELPERSVQTCITSPPYFGLRDYGSDGQIGLEPTPNEYVANLVEVFREVRRVLRDDGTVWLNLGDSYGSGEIGRHDRGRSSEGRERGWKAYDYGQEGRQQRQIKGGSKPKDLLGIPWLVAFALRADGWFLRSEIIWSKPNPMPESVRDRPTRAHEQVFLLSKRAGYWYDAEAIREPHTTEPWGDYKVKPKSQRPSELPHDPGGGLSMMGMHPAGRNKRSVWHIATHPYAEAHFATFPPKLIEPMVLAGSSPTACGECGAPWERIVERGHGDTEAHGRPKRTAGMDSATSTLSLSGNGSKEWAERGGRVTTTGWRPTCSHSDDTGQSLVLDPFCGSGTTGLVALRHGRSFVGIDLSESYCELARERIRGDGPLFNVGSEVAA